jgi:hypothetical protein
MIRGDWREVIRWRRGASAERREGEGIRCAACCVVCGGGACSIEKMAGLVPHYFGM